VSTSRESDTALHVGRVVDPSVREDGETEPEVQLAVPPVETAEAAVQAAPDSQAREAGDEMDAAASENRSIQSQAWVDPGHGQRPSFPRVDGDFQAKRDLELDLVGTQPIRMTPPVHPSAVEPKHRLSPGWTAVFGALLGLCTVATLIAIAIHLDKHPHKIAVASASASASAAPSASVAPAVVQDRRPPRVKIPGPWRIHDAESDATARIIDGRVGLDPLVKSIEKAGVPLKQFYRVIAAFAKVRPLTNCAKSDRYVVMVDRASKRIKAFEYITLNEDVFQAREGNDGLLTVQKLDLHVAQSRIASAVVIGDDGLEAAVLAGGLEKAIIGTLREALSGHTSLEELDRGTRLRVVAQETTVLGEFSRYAGIEALEIVQPDDDKKRERIYYFTGPESRGYFDSAGRAPYSGGWRKPIPGAPITSHFNPHRFHPILKRIMPHEGTDFGAPMGTPVGASSFGTVTFVGFAGPTGNFVRISHPGQIETGYAHLSRFAEGLKVGDKVKRLQIIGYVGSTGRSTGPHLHFSAKRAGKFFDAETLNLDGLRTLDQKERPLFEQTKNEYDKLLEAIALPSILRTPKPATAIPAASVAEGEEIVEGTVATAATNASAAPSTAASNQAPSKSQSNAVYLTDEELKNSRPGTDDGEVSE
jgi:murein DD-endopeptidase MepM/ murein hydrolase activator NlpD